jgi:ABC-2 type transport system permease protein
MGAGRFGIALGMARRGTKAWITSPAFVAITLFFPLIFLAALAGGLGPLYRVPGFEYPSGYSTFVFGFVVLQAAAFGGIFTGYSVARDFDLGVASRLLLAAGRRWELILGYVLVAVVRSAIAAAIVTGVALAAGMRVVLSPAGAGAIIALVVCLAAVSTLWACGVALRTRSMRAGPLMHTPILLVMFLSPVYVPAALLNGWLASVAGANPFSKVVESSRSILDGGNPDLLLTFGWLLAATVLLGIWALLGLRQAEEAY